MSHARLDRFNRRLLEERRITISLALLLLAVSLLLGWQWERRENAEQVRQTTVQARILAGSLTGALAFDDTATAQEYINALQLDEHVRAAGVYRMDGELVAGYSRADEQLPDRVGPQEPVVAQGQLSVVEPVRQASLDLGHVYLRTSLEPFAARLSRYFAIGAILLLAALLIAILGAANAAAAAANRKLQQEITAREQAETALTQAQKMEALGQLTGGVAHDFNNLLMAASSGLELLGRAKTDERREKLKAGIREALDRGARITEQLLAFSRRRPFQSEVIRFQEHIVGLADLLDHSLRENISVRFSVPDEIWSIKVDQSQFDVAILNLAVNAKDAMPKGGLLCISAENRPGGLDGEDGVEISVEDEGTGMSPDTLEKAFEPFYTTKEAGRGTGLGLSQVYGFAKAAGGRVSIHSEPGRGTTVSLLLPRCLPAPSASVQGSKASGSSPFAGMKILLVEDDPNLNELVSDMLEEQGASVIRAASAAEGLSLFEENPTDAVLTDMVMPGEMDGLDLARKLRERKKDLPIVLMTGYSEAANAAVAEGFTILRKPFTMTALAGCFGDPATRPPD